MNKINKIIDFYKKIGRRTNIKNCHSNTIYTARGLGSFWNWPFGKFLDCPSLLLLYDIYYIISSICSLFPVRAYHSVFITYNSRLQCIYSHIGTVKNVIFHPVRGLCVGIDFLFFFFKIRQPWFLVLYKVISSWWSETTGTRANNVYQLQGRNWKLISKGGDPIFF